jgi:hypothetical protein
VDRLIEPRKEQGPTLLEKMLRKFSAIDEKYIRRLEDEKEALEKQVASLEQIVSSQDKQLKNLKLVYRESSLHRAKLLSANQVQQRTIETLKDVVEQEEEQQQPQAPADPKEIREFETLLSLVDERPEVRK